MIWIFLAVISLAAVIFPYLVYPSVLSRLSIRPIAVDENAALPKSAIFFSAYNEGARLSRTIQWLRALKEVWPEIQIYAYNDLSSDNTQALLDGAADIIHVTHGLERSGKPFGLRTLIAQSDADIGIFMDANVQTDPASVQNLVRYFSDANIGSVGAKLVYTNGGENAVAETGSAFWRLEEKIKTRESQTGSMPGADGALFAVRLNLYPKFPDDAADDLRVSMEPVLRGQRCISASDVFVFEESTTNGWDEFRRKRRIGCGAWSAHRDMRPLIKAMPWRDRFKYFAHKKLRWFNAGFLLLSYVFLALAALQYAVFVPFLVLTVAGLLVLYFARNTRLIGMIVNVLLAMIATQIGIIECMVGRSYRAWTPAESR